MILNITSKHMEITPAIRDHIEDRINKLNKWGVTFRNPQVIITKEPHNFIVEAIISVATTSLVASAKAEDLYLAVNELLLKLERQLNKVQHKNDARRATASIKTLQTDSEI